MAARPNDTYLKAAYLGLSVAALVHTGKHFGYVIDDAYISFRYARNLVRGAGLVYNPGDYVQGFSNPLYTLFAAIPEWLGQDPGHWGACLGIVSLGLICVLIARFCRTRGFHAVGLVAIALTAASSSLAHWHAAALETGLYTLLVTAGVLRRLDETEPGAALPQRAWLWFCAAVWCRPEGILLFAAVVGHELLARVSGARWRRADLAFLSLPPLAYAAQLCCSKLYYGAWLPQTFAAKVGRFEDASLVGRLGDDLTELRTSLVGDGYVADGLASYGGSACLLLLAVGLWQTRTRRVAAAIGCVVLAQLAFIAHVHGDWMHGSRFLVPILPLLFVGMALPLAGLGERAPAARAGLAVVATALLVYSTSHELSRSHDLSEARYVDGRAMLVEAARLESLLGPGRTLSSFDVGAHAYGTRLEVLDTGGLTSPWLTHMRRAEYPVRKALGAALEPDLIRLQNNGRDKLFWRPFSTGNRYVELANHMGGLRRELVFPRKLPGDHVALSETSSVGPLRVLAHRLPRVARPNEALEGELFLRHDASEGLPGESCPMARELWFVDAKGARKLAEANRSRLSVLGNCGAWKAGALYADWLTLRAPSTPGTYRVELKLPDGSVPVLELQVTDDTRALQGAASRELGEARSRFDARGWDAAAWHALEAHRLSPGSDSRHLAHRAAIEAARVAQRGERTTTSGLREARHQLYRAYFAAPPISRSLRVAVDDNGRAWHRHLCRAMGRDDCDS